MQGGSVVDNKMDLDTKLSGQVAMQGKPINKTVDHMHKLERWVTNEIKISCLKLNRLDLCLVYKQWYKVKSIH